MGEDKEREIAKISQGMGETINVEFNEQFKTRSLKEKSWPGPFRVRRCVSNGNPCRSRVSM